MTISEALDVENSNLDYITEYFPLKIMNPDVWTFPVTDKGIDGIELLQKEYGLWKDVIKQNNIGRFLGTDKHKVQEMCDDISQNKVDPNQPPVFIDVETGDIITGGHRHDACSILGIPGWMFQYVKCNDHWARKRFAKALNNERVFACTLNNKAEVIEHIKYGIKEGKITCQQDIDDEAYLIAGNGCCKSKAVRATIVKEMVSYITTKGIAPNFQLERYTDHNDNTYNDFVCRSTDEYVRDVINNPDVRNYYINMENWGSRTHGIIMEASKCKPDSWLNIQASVALPSKVESLSVKRKKVHDVSFANLSHYCDNIRIYHAVNGCYPWDNPNCQHAFLAQDHHKEGVQEGEFIRLEG